MKNHDGETDWQGIANQCARFAGEREFDSRRGSYPLCEIEDADPGRTVLVVYNNNPYSADPGARDDELRRAVARLKAEGIEELATGRYPPFGEEQDGYLYAVIFDAQEKTAQDRVNEVFTEETRRTGRMLASRMSDGGKDGTA
jgi:hypothetical protein